MRITKGEFEILEFQDGAEFRKWLTANHDTSPGIFIRMYKKASGVQKLEYVDALDEALCFGWIDSIVHKYDDSSYIQKFGPRRARSIWSKINIEKVARLIEDGRMTAAGMVEIEKAQADGRWASAYDSPKNMELPEDFLQLLRTHAHAHAFFETLNKTNRYAIGWRLQTAKKPETRERRMHAILDMLDKGEKFH